MAIVDLDRTAKDQRPGRDRGALLALAAATSIFALAVWSGKMTVPSAQSQSMATVAADTLASSTGVPRGMVLRPLALPESIDDIELAFMPDRLANEAAPWTLRAVVTVRGLAGVASVEGPAVISWTESGIAYQLASATRTTGELVAIADGLR